MFAILLEGITGILGAVQIDVLTYNVRIDKHQSFDDKVTVVKHLLEKDQK